MKSLVLVICSLGVALATYPPYVPSTSMSGSRIGMSPGFMSSIQPGFNTQGFSRMQQPNYMLGTMMNSQPISSSMNGRLMSGGSSSGRRGFIGRVVQTSTGEMGVVPSTRTTTRYTVLPPGVGIGALSGAGNAFNGMSGTFNSAPYMAGGTTGLAGGSPYMTGGFAGGSPYMNRGMTGIAGGSPYMNRGMTGIAGGSPYMVGSMATSGRFPLSNSFNINGVGGQSSTTYRPFGQSVGSSFYPYTTGMATGMRSFPQMSPGGFNSFSGSSNAFGFSPVMHHKKRGAY